MKQLTLVVVLVLNCALASNCHPGLLSDLLNPVEKQTEPPTIASLFGQTLTDFIDEIFQNIENLFGENNRFRRDTSNGLLGSIFENVENTVGNILGTKSVSIESLLFQLLIDQIKQWISQLFSNFKTELNLLLDGQDVKNAVQKLLRRRRDIAGSLLGDIFRDTEDSVGKIMKSTSSSVSNVFDKVGKLTGDLLGKTQTETSGLFGGMSNLLGPAGIESILKYVTKINKILQDFGIDPSKLLDLKALRHNWKTVLGNMGNYTEGFIKNSDQNVRTVLKDFGLDSETVDNLLKKTTDKLIDTVQSNVDNLMESNSDVDQLIDTVLGNITSRTKRDTHGNEMHSLRYIVNGTVDDDNKEKSIGSDIVRIDFGESENFNIGVPALIGNVLGGVLDREGIRQLSKLFGNVERIFNDKRLNIGLLGGNNKNVFDVGKDLLKDVVDIKVIHAILENIKESLKNDSHKQANEPDTDDEHQKEQSDIQDQKSKRHHSNDHQKSVPETGTQSVVDVENNPIEKPLLIPIPKNEKQHNKTQRQLLHKRDLVNINDSNEHSKIGDKILSIEQTARKIRDRAWLNLAKVYSDYLWSSNVNDGIEKIDQSIQKQEDNQKKGLIALFGLKGLANLISDLIHKNNRTDNQNNQNHNKTELGPLKNSSENYDDKLPNNGSDASEVNSSIFDKIKNPIANSSRNSLPESSGENNTPEIIRTTTTEPFINFNPNYSDPVLKTTNNSRNSLSGTIGRPPSYAINNPYSSGSVFYEDNLSSFTDTSVTNADSRQQNEDINTWPNNTTKNLSAINESATETSENLTAIDETAKTTNNSKNSLSGTIGRPANYDKNNLP